MGCCSLRTQTSIYALDYDNVKLKSTPFLILFFCFIETPLSAQNSVQSTFEHNLRAGISFNFSPNSFKGWGTIKNCKMAFINGQFWHTTINRKSFRARVASELIITHWVSYPEDGIDGPTDQRIGFGLVPVHIVVPFSGNSITPFFTASAGLLLFNDRLPAIGGATFNYKLNSGLGVELPIGSDRKIQIGYQLQHISNGNRSDENPGIDSHVFFANLIFSKW